jgi:hypothetical protein
MAAVFHWREFDEPLDGVIYGVAVSLGFATLENLLYLDRMGLAIAWQRAVFAVPAHALFGGAMGYYAGRAKFDRRAARGPRPRDFVLTLALPTGVPRPLRLRAPPRPRLARVGRHHRDLHRSLGVRASPRAPRAACVAVPAEDDATEPPARAAG